MATTYICKKNIRQSQTRFESERQSPDFSPSSTESKIHGSLTRQSDTEEPGSGPRPEPGAATDTFELVVSSECKLRYCSIKAMHHLLI